MPDGRRPAPAQTQTLAGDGRPPVTRLAAAPACCRIVTFSVAGYSTRSCPAGTVGQIGAPASSVAVVTRIVAGTLGGRRLDPPAGSRTRPTSDRVREALFSTLESLADLAGARFADLYAGSGAVGLEAFSRGAGHVLLVESDPKAARAARANIAAMQAAPAVRLVTGTVQTVLSGGAGTEPPYDIVFADPPYSLPGDQLVAMQQALLDGGWLAPGAVLAIERSRRSGALRWVEPVTELRTRRYGETTLWYGRRS